MTAVQDTCGSAGRADRMVAFLREYASERLNSRLIDERRCLPPSLFSDFGSAGLMGMQAQREYGGQELTHRDCVRIMTQLAAIDPNVMLAVGMHNFLALPPILCYANDSVKREILPDITSGKQMVACGVSEPGAGSHVGAISTLATAATDGSYTITGGKAWISFGESASHLSIFAKTVNGQGKPSGLTGFLVSGLDKGLRPGPEALTLGMRGVPQNWLTFDELKVPPERILGYAGQGDAVVHTTLTSGRITIAAMGLGAMKRCIQLAHRYARRRRIGTGLLLDNGRTQWVLAASIAATSAVESIVDYIAGSQDCGRPLPDMVPIAAKIMGSELSWKVIDSSVQLLGARGFLDTNIIGKFFRDFRVLRIFEGPTDALIHFLGLRLLSDPDQLLQWEPFTRLPAAGQVAAVAGELRLTGSAGLREKHLIIHDTGMMACWAILASAAHARPHTDGELNTYTQAWCDHHLLASLDAVRKEGIVAPGLITAGVLDAHIDGYASMIGDIEQHAHGEYIALDPLLRRIHP